MIPSYEHTQKTLWMIVILAVVLILSIGIGVGLVFVQGIDITLIIIVYLASSIAILGIIIVFSSLTVQLQADCLKFYFGPGLFGKTITLTDIVSCTPVKNRWWYGWGIRKIPNGRLYNIAGLDAVELILKTGKRIRIGTDQPAELAEAVNSALPSAG